MAALRKSLLDPAITWFGRPVPAALEVAMVAILGLVMLSVAIVEFNAGE